MSADLDEIGPENVRIDTQPAESVRIGTQLLVDSCSAFGSAAILWNMNNRQDFRIRVALVDNDAFTLDMLKMAIPRRNPRFDVCWSARKGTDAIDWALEPVTMPDILLTDMSLEDISGVSVCREIRRRTEQVPLLAITAFSIDRYANRAAEAGAQGIIPKVNLNELVDSIDVIVKHGTLGMCGNIDFVDAKTAHQRLAESDMCPIQRLSPTEQQILTLLAQGMEPRDIADMLSIGIGTVKTHIIRLRKKLNARSTKEAMAMWWNNER